MGAAFQSRAGRRATADPMSHTPILTIVLSIKKKNPKAAVMEKAKAKAGFASGRRHHALRNERSEESTVIGFAFKPHYISDGRPPERILLSESSRSARRRGLALLSRSCEKKKTHLKDSGRLEVPEPIGVGLTRMRLVARSSASRGDGDRSIHELQRSSFSGFFDRASLVGQRAPSRLDLKRDLTRSSAISTRSPGVMARGLFSSSNDTR